MGSLRGPEVVVVGAGAFGGWTALELARSGARVTLVDALEPGASQTSSGGESRLIRAVYGDSERYTEWAVRALARWREGLGNVGGGLLVPTGLLWLQPRGTDAGYLEGARRHLTAVGVELEPLTAAAVAERWPQVTTSDLEQAWFEPEAGVLLARQATRRVAEAAAAVGAVLRRGKFAAEGVEAAGGRVVVRLEQGEQIVADQAVLACGPWLGQVLPSVMGPLIRPTRQDIVFFATPPGVGDFDAGTMPAWIEFGERMFYGVPNLEGRGFKVADDTRGTPVDPSTLERIVDPAAVDRARRQLAHRFPALAAAAVTETRVCQYENSPDGGLILDEHPDLPGVWIAGGGSGHGFKLGPVVGETMAAAVLGRELPPADLGLARFAGLAATWRTQFDG